MSRNIDGIVSITVEDMPSVLNFRGWNEIPSVFLHITTDLIVMNHDKTSCLLENITIHVLVVLRCSFYVLSVKAEKGIYYITDKYTSRNSIIQISNNQKLDQPDNKIQTTLFFMCRLKKMIAYIFALWAFVQLFR